MTRSSFAIVLAVGFAALAACSTSSDSDDENVETEDAELKALELKCRSGSARFDVRPGAGGASEGLLDTGAVRSSFVCGAPRKADAGADAGSVASGVVAVCYERPQQVHAGRWEASITKSGVVYRATIKRGYGADLSLACTAPAGDAGGAVVEGGGGAAVPTYAEIAPILDATCGGCHVGVFNALDKLKKRRRQMIDAVSAGRMPRGRPTWRDSADGQKLLAFLRGSTEL
ncbi:MAG TPA: hypothetical protein VM925_34565 [Labilithrix sp.]|jgi:hypothetical protein|nr:hypothetical protein [Labilithrix sp.]